MAITLRQGYVLTFLAWLSVAAVGALPLVFSELQLSYTDAFFETMSGITTTGSTVLVGLDTMPRSILLWRALTQWLGGVGIVVMAIAILPWPLALPSAHLEDPEGCDSRKYTCAQHGRDYRAGPARQPNANGCPAIIGGCPSASP
jgi:Trk-type K+ transport system membrane component